MSDLMTLGEQLKRKNISSSDFVNAETLVSIKDGVRVFNITSGGAVCSPSDFLPVYIVRLKDEPQVASPPTGKQRPLFLHVGDWLYPLVQDESPVLYSSSGAYLFPDLMACDWGKSSQSIVAFMLPDDLLSETKQLFQDLIKSSALFLDLFKGHTPSLVNVEPETKEKQQRHFQRLSLAADKLTQGLFDAAAWIADEVEKGADKVKEKVTEETHKFLHKHEITVDPQIREGIIYAQEVTDSAVKVSGYVLNKLGEITIALGKDISKHATKVPRRSSDVDRAGSSSECDSAFSTLHRAARILDRCLVGGMEDVTRYKFGENPV